jgi:polar amino acid transport system substrate-binding protein
MQHPSNRRTFCAATVAAAAALCGCAATGKSPAASASDARAAVAELTPTGKLRAAINFGNPILASRGALRASPRACRWTSCARPRGASAFRSNWCSFNSAGSVVEAVKARQVDLAFVAIDPVRAADMDYTAPYVIIEGAYLVRDASPLRRNEDVDRAGTRIVVGRGSAYDLFLTREIKAATLVRAPTSPAVTDMFIAQSSTWPPA